MSQNQTSSQIAHWTIQASNYRSQARHMELDAKLYDRGCRAVRSEIARLDRMADSCEESAQFVQHIR